MLKLFPIADFKPGDDAQWPGVIKIEGVTDYSTYSLIGAVKVRSQSDGSPVGDALAEMSFSAISTDGKFTASIPRADTSEWPEDSELVTDVVAVLPTGDLRMTSGTQIFKTVKRVTAIP